MYALYVYAYAGGSQLEL